MKIQYMLGFICLLLGLLNTWNYFSTKDIPGYSITLNLVLIALAITPILVMVVAGYTRFKLKNFVISVSCVVLVLQVLVLIGSNIAG